MSYLPTLTHILANLPTLCLTSSYTHLHSLRFVFTQLHTLTHIPPHLPTLSHTQGHTPTLTHVHPHPPTLTNTYPYSPTSSHTYPSSSTSFKTYRYTPTSSPTLPCDTHTLPLLQTLPPHPLSLTRTYTHPGSTNHPHCPTFTRLKVPSTLHSSTHSHTVSSDHASLYTSSSDLFVRGLGQKKTFLPYLSLSESC